MNNGRTTSVSTFPCPAENRISGPDSRSQAKPSPIIVEPSSQCSPHYRSQACQSWHRGEFLDAGLTGLGLAGPGLTGLGLTGPGLAPKRSKFVFVPADTVTYESQPSLQNFQMCQLVVTTISY